MKYLNKDSIKSGWLNLTEKYNIICHNISTGSANGVASLAIVATCISLVTTNINYTTVRLAESRIIEAKLAIEATEQKAQHKIEVAKIKAKAQRDVVLYQARAEEARAASNPYVIAAEHSNTPVNVFIDSNNGKYVVETSDGATEIAISTIKVQGIKYTPEQRKLMTIAFHIGKEVGYPETIQSLLLQETRAGAIGDRIGDTNLPVGKRSYGVMQMKVATARKVMKKYAVIVPNYFPNRKSYKNLRDEEIIIKLIQDDEFNIRLAALNFTIHRRLSKSWAQAVVAYNTGQGAANGIETPKEHAYYTHILKKLISEVRPFNSHSELVL